MDDIVKKTRKRRMLESFKWSSYSAYVGKTKIPECLDVASVLGKFESGNEEERRKYLMNLTVTDPKDQRDLAKLKRSLAFEKILSRTAKYFKTDTRELLRKSSRSEARKALMYLAGKYCRGKMSLTEIGHLMSIGQSGFVRSKNRFESELGNNGEVSLRLRKIEEELKSIADSAIDFGKELVQSAESRLVCHRQIRKPLKRR
jgi:hypothetical protein